MSWDRGLDFEKTMKMLLKDYSEEDNLRKKTKIAILIVQLRNGSRVSEAIEALSIFKSTGERVVEVRVRKKKKPTMRKMVIPEVIKKSHIAEIPSVGAVKVFCIRRYGFNTHALRFAFVSFLGMRGISPQLIAKITKHSKLDLVLTYTEEKMAEKILLELP